MEESMKVVKEGIDIAKKLQAGMSIEDIAKEKVKQDKDSDWWDNLKKRGSNALSEGGKDALKGGLGGGLAGSVIPGVGTAAGATGGAIIGGVYGAVKGFFSDIEGKAVGGISSGSPAGFLEKLHGTEAVVPLPDGRSIPVAMDFKNMPMDNMASIVAQPMEKIGGGLANLTSVFQGFNIADPIKSVVEQQKTDMVNLFNQMMDSTESTKTLHKELQKTFGEVGGHLSELKETAVKQLDVHGTIAKLTGEAKDVSERILNNSF
jgi:hypothetical protein